MSTLVLDTTTKTIQVAMSGAAATANPDFTAAFADNNGTSFVEAASDGALSGSTDVVVVAAPASGFRRIIKKIFIENKDTAAVTITVKYDNNGTQRTIAKVTLQVGDTWTTDGTFDTNGALKQTLGSVNLNSVTGTLAVANGGTGLTSLTAGRIPYGNGTSAFGNESNLTYDDTNNRFGVVGTGYSPNITLTDAATVAWDTTTGQVATFTFVSSNRTMGAPSSLVSGAFYALAVIQNAGSNTLTWNSVFKWANGTAPTLSTAASAKDYFVFRSDGTNLYEQGRSQGVA
jgi:hypothetical protein